MLARHLTPGLALGALLAACGSSGEPGPVGPVASITIAPPLDTLLVAASAGFTAVARDADGQVIAGTSFIWQVSNDTIASVSPAGVVTGHAPGTATLSASAGGITGQATIVVRLPPVASVTVSPLVDSVPVGSVIQYQAVARDANNMVIPGAYPTWSSGETTVATVSPTGLVQGIGPGVTAITAEIDGLQGSAAVTVQQAFPRADTVATPLTDLAGTYLSFPGGLYPGGNAIPPAHLAAGTALARGVVPLDLNGNPSGLGRYVLMSLGMSNTTEEWCAAQWNAACNSWSFMGQAAADPDVRSGGLVIVNGAKAAQTAPTWLQPGGPNYTRIRDSVLAPLGLSELQVQVIWIKLANPRPSVSLPQAGADALLLYNQLGSILRTLQMQYPRLKLVFLTSRVFAGYNAVALNPEPYAYEYGFSVKWLIGEQIRQAATPTPAPDPAAGDLDYRTGVVPWVAWGPYLWTRGAEPRSDGLSWPQTYFEPDGVHPSVLGEMAVGAQLLAFFKTAAVTRCWFVSGGTCP